MRTILRVGVTVGGVAFVTLFALQPAIGLAVVPAIVVSGLVAGLGAAKWLERTWYGQQLDAGLRTAAIAVGMAGAGSLLALLTQGPHTVSSLAERSHLFLLDLGPLIMALAGAGWAAIDILSVALAMIAGIALGAGTTAFGAWSKNQRAIQVVNQARLAAQASLYDNRSSLSGLFGVPAPASRPQTLEQAGTHTASTGSGATLGNHRLVPSGAERFPPVEPAPLQTVRFPQSSDARPASTQLTQDMRDALATWAADTSSGSEADNATAQTGGAAAPTPRTPPPSNYLNSPPPVPAKRQRKKQNTEWLR